MDISDEVSVDETRNVRSVCYAAHRKMRRLVVSRGLFTSGNYATCDSHSYWKSVPIMLSSRLNNRVPNQSQKGFDLFKIPVRHIDAGAQLHTGRLFDRKTRYWNEFR